MSRDFDDLIEAARNEWLARFVAGPKRLAWDGLPPQIGDHAPDIELLDTAGEWRNLSDFWTDGPALLLFWRHFGCGCGIERAEQLVEEFDGYVEAGASVAIVGQGDPERGARYADEYRLECPLLCDPDGAAHETYGLLEFALPQVWYELPAEEISRYRASSETYAQEFAEEYRADGRPKVDNPWQQPGEFVVDGDGVLRLTYRYQYCEDYPDSRVLMTAIRESTS